MRMDRYDDEEKKNVDSTPSRLNKNQELYTDVYLNNVYVDINNLKDVMKEEEEKEEPKVVKEQIPVDYTYEEKNYDIVSILDEALKNREKENPKKNVDLEADNLEIDNIISSINEKTQDEKQDNDNLLSELMPENDNTEVIPALEEPILDTSIYNQSVLVLPPEEETDEYQLLTGEIPKDLEEDDYEFVPKKKPKVFIVIIVVGIIISIVIGVVILKILQVI